MFPIFNLCLILFMGLRCGADNPVMQAASATARGNTKVNCQREGYEYQPLSGSCYKFHRVALAFRSALATCHEEGAILAIINSDNESDVLRAMFRKNAELITGTGDKSHAFVGFRKYEDDQWGTIFGTTLENAGFAQWSPGEPNNLGGDEVCGSIFRDGLLNDISCTKLPLAFICEIILS